MENEPGIVRAACHAMATRFEIVLTNGDPVRLRAAAEEALEEIVRWEAALSLYRPESDIARVNAGAAAAPIRVRPQVFRLLQQARELSRISADAFDPTVGPLVKAWGFMGGNGKVPDSSLIEEARQRVGWNSIELIEADQSVRFLRPGMMLDLGAIGKGFALDQAAELLKDAGVTSALLHGGTSSVVAIGTPSGRPGWRVALPLVGDHAFSEDHVDLVDQSLSVSGVHGKAFLDGDRLLGHVLDPRIGQPVEGARMAAVILPSATESDALSTALLVLGKEGVGFLSMHRSEGRFLVAERVF